MAGFKDFYQFSAPTRVIAGRDLLSASGFEFAKEGARRVLLVTDGVIRATGLVDRVADGVIAGGLELTAIFDEVPQDSGGAVVAAIAALAGETGADAFLAVGGGSVMDSAKVANVLFTHGGEARDWEGFYGLPRGGDGLGAPIPLAPLAAVPTTAGTGSEVSFVAVVRDRGARVKYQIADFPLIPRLAILDPAATATLPPAIAAATGMDAMTHAIEGYVSRDWNPHGDACALHALRLIRANLERAVHQPDDETARGNMLIAACLAIVPSTSGALGIAHSLAHPCGACSTTSRTGSRSRSACRRRSRTTRRAAWTARRATATSRRCSASTRRRPRSAAALAAHIRELVRSLGLPTRLSQVGVPEAAIAELVAGAMGDACTLVNPREPTEAEIERSTAACCDRRSPRRAQPVAVVVPGLAGQQRVARSPGKRSRGRTVASGCAGVRRSARRRSRTAPAARGACASGTATAARPCEGREPGAASERRRTRRRRRPARSRPARARGRRARRSARRS